MTTKWKLTWLAAGSLAVLVPAVVRATPGAGFLFNMIVNRATTADPIHETGHVGNWNVVLQTNGASDFVVQDVALAPGGYSGWHQHPGPVLLTVKRGTATVYQVEGSVCIPLVFPVGSAFVEPAGVTHALQNEGATELELVNTYIIPAGVATRIEAPDPGVCPGVQ